MKLQRTGLTEGSLLFNDWLKTKGLYREDTEAEFINWLYSTSGWYDKDISGTYFDIDVEAVRKSDNYQRFLKAYHEALKKSDWFHLMLHSGYHLNGLELAEEFAKQYSATNRAYWREPEFLRELMKNKRVLVVSSISQLITDKYRTPENQLLGYTTPQNLLNNGDQHNGWETLDKVTSDMMYMLDWFDFAIISFGAYGVLLADRIHAMGKDVATVGSGIYDLFPVGEIPAHLKPEGWEKIEDGRYWR